MKTLAFYKNQILIDKSAGTNRKQVVACPSCHAKYLVATAKNAIRCVSCGTTRKVGEANGYFKRHLPDGTTEYRV